MAVGAILGSAFSREPPAGLGLEPVSVPTPWGEYELARVKETEPPAHVSFRHGRPHRRLPHEIPYRAQAWAFREVGCRALLVTSSVGVLRPDFPLGRILRVRDLVTADNRLPDGSACTIFHPPCPLESGHLVLEEGLFSSALSDQVSELARDVGVPPAGDVVFGYVGGPRGKTAAENRAWRKRGADVNSMTLAPEVVLANELKIPCAGAVTGHKYSLPAGEEAPDNRGMPDASSVTASLEESRPALERLVSHFLRRGRPVPFGNRIYRFGDD